MRRISMALTATAAALLIYTREVRAVEGSSAAGLIGGKALASVINDNAPQNWGIAFSFVHKLK